MLAIKRYFKKLVFNILEKPKIRIALRAVQIPFAVCVIMPFGLFDREWYQAQYAGERGEKIRRLAPLLHYLIIGRIKGLSPNPFFVGEYFDRGRWDKSILDPLLKYALFKRNWHKPTSILFDGSRVKGSGNILPPLIGYIRQMHNKPESLLLTPADVYVDNKKMWVEVKNQYYELVRTRTQQHEIRRIADPVGIFDTIKEKRVIAKYSTYQFRGEAPLVSVIMPVWNRKSVVVDAINSVLAQTYKNWELLVVDDGSTDGSIEVIDSFVKTDKRIKLIKGTHQGVCRARNAGIEKAKGTWIAFLDSDNTWSEKFLQTTVGMADDMGYEAAYAAVRMDGGGVIRYRVTEPNPELLKTGNYIDLNTLIVKKNILNQIGNFDESLRRMVDYDLVCKISKKTDFLYVPTIGVNYVDHDDLVRITTTESISWDGVVKNNNHIEWNKTVHNRKPGTISIIVPVRGSIHTALECLNNIAVTTRSVKVEVIVVDASSNSAINTTIGAFSHLNNMKYYREPAVRDTVLATNYGFAHSTGETIVVVNQHVSVEGDWLVKLTSGLKENQIAGPLQLQPNRNIRSAGVEYIGENKLPVNVLEDHPLSDADKLPIEFEVTSLMSGCFALSSALFAQLKGLNPLYDKAFETYDLCNRAVNIHHSKIVIRKESIVLNPDGGKGWYSEPQNQYMRDWSGRCDSKTSSVWKIAGFNICGYDLNFPEHKEKSSRRPILETIKDKGKYRWAIKISAPANEKRFRWGDYYYALALAKSLKKLGQTVAIDFHDNHLRSTAYLDDIILDLRGLDDVLPQKNALNIMWVISHPELISPERLTSYDLVFAAGKKWASTMSSKLNKQIHFLPQCTEFSLKNSMKPDASMKEKIVFIASSRNISRPIVVDSINAGLDISIYGGGWNGMVESKYIEAEFIPNSEVPRAYASAKIVLNDHWKDMKEWGFLSNRLFDAAAMGARIVSDNVDGVEEIFGNHVYVYETVDDLVRLKEGEGNLFPTIQERKKFATYITKHHSFDARANTLLKEANKAIVTRSESN